MDNKMTAELALPKPEDALAYLINRLVTPTSADAASNTSRSIESLRQALSAPRVPELTVRVMSFPESNGKRNWTAMFVRKEPWGGLPGNCGGITICRGELWNRVAYEAECARLLLGERETQPDILDYGDDIETPDKWAGEVRGGHPVKERAMLTASPEPVAQAQAEQLCKHCGGKTMHVGDVCYSCSHPPAQVAPKGRNEYGLDVSYFHGKLSQIVRDCQRYTPDEMARSLARLAVVADESVLAEKEFSKHATSQDQQVIAELRAEVEALKETRVMVPYLKNHADAVDGHYCIARLHPHGYHEFWNKEQKEWCSAGSVFELGKIDPDAARLREGGE